MNAKRTDLSPMREAALLRHAPFLRYYLARGLGSFAYQMAAVAVGWQIYALTHSAFLLGMVGLAQFIPAAGLVFFAGHVSDRYSRKHVVMVCQIFEAMASLLLALSAFGHWESVGVIFAAVVVIAAARSFENPAMSALLNAVLPEGAFQLSLIHISEPTRPY